MGVVAQACMVLDDATRTLLGPDDPIIQRFYRDSTWVVEKKMEST